MQTAIKPRFSVLTPCYDAMPWIKAAVRSVADQEGVSVEHLVQDALSKDGTAEYVMHEPSLDAVSERDAGMYDAINRAWARSRGDYILHLNADEEVLPGALAEVAAYFDAHPEIDIVIGGVLICERDGSLQCYRIPLRPTLPIMLTSHHPVQSCGIFFRASALAGRAWMYDPAFSIVSDVLLMIDLVRQGHRIALLEGFTSVFFMTGKNMGLTQSARSLAEHAHQRSLAPRWMSVLRPFWRIGFRLRKQLAGAYRRRRIQYGIYVPDGDAARVHFTAENAGGVYRPGQTQDVAR